MTDLMAAFPPDPESQVTLENWRTSPFNRWGFQHVCEIVPSASIRCDKSNIWQLPNRDVPELDGFRFENDRGGMIDLELFFNSTHTDAFVLVHKGSVLVEHYANGMRPETPHILMSVSKSVLGLLAGILAADGILDLAAPVSQYVPELVDGAFEGASVRELLDMRTGLDFSEDYLAISGPIIAYRKATNWNPLEPGEAPTDLRAFLPTLKARSGAHGGPFNYTSPCTDLLGWVIERATGTRYADLLSEMLWRPLGASENAYVTVDRLGAPRCAGGLCMTAMDLARVGQLIVTGGERSGKTIISREWIDDILTAGDPVAWERGPFAQYWPGRDMHYRAQWYVDRGTEPMMFGYGIHGQHLYVDRANELVIAKFSSGPTPVDPDQIALTTRAIDAVRKRLTT